MDRTLIQDIAKGKEVFLQGWVHEFRDLSKVKFIILRDYTCCVQCVVKKDSPIFSQLGDLKHEDVVQITGDAIQSNVTSPLVLQGVEVVVKNLEVLNKVHGTLPLTVFEKEIANTDLSVRLDNRVLDLRKPQIAAIFKVKSALYRAAVEYFSKMGFTNVATPKITSAGVESGAELFELDYFGKPAFLAQSPQIYKQMLIATGLERVYELGPVFRAEKSRTTRHVTEFTGIDFEMAFIKDENGPMDIIEGMVRHMLEVVKKDCAKELEMFNVKVQIPKEIPRITMDEARKMLSAEGKEVPEDDDFDPEGEKLLGDIIKKKLNSDFVFVTRYPWKKRPFYHHKPQPGAKVTCSFDLIWDGVEVSTGAQREHNYETLKAQAKEKGLDLDAMKDYANLFRWGCPPHGGAGLGLDRMAQRLLNLENVKEAILFPRDPDRLNP